MGKASSVGIFRQASDFYIWFIRGTPALIQIFIVYFGLPQFGIRLSPFVAGVVALGFNGGAYVAEIIRSGSVGHPQGPDGIVPRPRHEPVRRDVPDHPAAGRPHHPAGRSPTRRSSTLKNTSLLSTITVVELTLYAQTIIATTFRPFEFYIATARHLPRADDDADAGVGLDGAAQCPLPLSAA